MKTVGLEPLVGPELDAFEAWYESHDAETTKDLCRLLWRHRSNEIERLRAETQSRCLLRALQIVGWHFNSYNRAQLQPVYDDLARAMPNDAGSRARSASAGVQSCAEGGDDAGA